MWVLSICMYVCVYIYIYIRTLPGVISNNTYSQPHKSRSRRYPDAQAMKPVETSLSLGSRNLTGLAGQQITLGAYIITKLFLGFRILIIV